MKPMEDVAAEADSLSILDLIAGFFAFVLDGLFAFLGLSSQAVSSE